MFKELDPILHSQLRLAVVSLLIGVKEAEFTFNLYPNPADEALCIELNGVMEYFISDETGRQISKGVAQNKTIIPTSSLASGVYIVTIGDTKQRFVVQH